MRIYKLEKQIHALHFKDFKDEIEVTFSPPRKCPHCNVSTHDDEIIAFYVPANHVIQMLVLFFCTACDHMYVAIYNISRIGFTN